MSLRSLLHRVARPVKQAIKAMGLKETALRFSYRRGIPCGLERERLHRIVLDLTGSGLASVTYRHMSGWKNSGAYRLLVRTMGNTKLSLVYKNALYSQDEIPALADLPITPGLGEYIFLKHSDENLTKFLPRVFFAEELETGRHYQYLMEDLTQAYRGVTGPQDRIRLCCALPDIHGSFSQLAQHPESSRLFRFDRDFNERLLVYCRQSLEANQQLRLSPAIDAILEDWTNFAGTFRASSDAVHRSEPLKLVHGDCNMSNIMWNKHTGSVKLLDLEWAAWGIPHQDLASALNGAPEDLEAGCLEAFSRNLGSGRLERDWNLYRHCGIQRALLDAGFVGKQMLDAKSRTPAWFPKFIDDSCTKALTLSRLLDIRRI